MISMSLPAPSFNDGRGLYPERLSVTVPRGFPAVVKQAAEAEKVSVAEFVRRAVAHRVSMATDGEKA
ncbi:protein of unknown function [Methylorubrum extorquens]|uniref:Ribbon-helix-helix protein CopG domain-containing protein n=1 Tax=Methylorubrum extorquens TaxID=408 RepID=A0A2N9ASN9_METEX|nr:protein of unknown function [Methylorubrum extorquens]